MFSTDFIGLSIDIGKGVIHIFPVFQLIQKALNFPGIFLIKNCGFCYIHSRIVLLLIIDGNGFRTLAFMGIKQKNSRDDHQEQNANAKND